MRHYLVIALAAFGLVMGHANAQDNMTKDVIHNEFTLSKSRSSNGMHLLRYTSKTDTLSINDIIVNKGRCHTVFAKFPLQAALNTSIEVYVDCEPFSVKTTTANKDYLKFFNNY